MSNSTITIFAERLTFLHWIAFMSLSKVIWTCLYGSISGFSILHWSVWQYHTALTTIATEDFKWRRLISFHFILLFQNSFSYSSFFEFPYEVLNNLTNVYKQNLAGISIGIMYQFKENWQLYCAEYSKLWN